MTETTSNPPSPPVSAQNPPSTASPAAAGPATVFAGSTAGGPPDPGRSRGLGGKDMEGAKPIEPELEELLKDASDEDVQRIVEEYDEEQKAKKGEKGEKPPETGQKDDKKPEKQAKTDKKGDDRPPAKVKIKVGEEEKELDFDEVQRGYNQGLKLESHAKDALDLHEASVKTIRGLVENPSGVLIDAWAAYYGGDREKAYATLVQFADSISKRHFELAQMPEAERNLLITQDELKMTRDRLQTFEQARQKEAKRAAFEAAKQKWTDDISAGLQQAKLPVDHRHLSMVADILVHARQSGLDMSIPKAVERARGEMQKVLSEASVEVKKTLTYDDIKDNTALIEEIRKRDLAEVRAAKSKTGAGNGTRPQETEAPRRKRRISTIDEL